MVMDDFVKTSFRACKYEKKPLETIKFEYDFFTMNEKRY